MTVKKRHITGKRVVGNVAMVLAIIAIMQCVCVVGAVGTNFWLNDISANAVTLNKISDERIEADNKIFDTYIDAYRGMYVVEDITNRDILLQNKSLNVLLNKTLRSDITLGMLDSGDFGNRLDGAMFGVNENGKCYKDYYEEYRKYSKTLKLTFRFVPTKAVLVKRDVYLVGGYFDYSNNNFDVDDATDRFVEYITRATREIVSKDAREIIHNSIDNLFKSMQADNRYKIFYLKGKEFESSKAIIADFDYVSMFDDASVIELHEFSDNVGM